MTNFTTDGSGSCLGSMVCVGICVFGQFFPALESHGAPQTHPPIWLHMQGLRFKKAMLNLRSSKSFVLYSKHACFRLLRLLTRSSNPVSSSSHFQNAYQTAPLFLRHAEMSETHRKLSLSRELIPL